jgi:aryl-alcohol dehydrogenase-like predicted oxidoreductase
MAKGEDIVPIPGTKRTTYLEENAAAADVELSSDDVAALDEAVSRESVTGTRYRDSDMALLNN